MTDRLARLLRLRGRDPGAVAARARVSLEELRSPTARVAWPVAERFVEECVAELGLDGFSTALAAVFDESTYDAAGLALLSSPTFGEGLARAFGYQRLWGDGERFSFDDGGASTGGTVRFRHPGTSRLAAAVFAEVAFVETLSAVRRLVDPAARPVAVRFEHAPLSGTPILSETLGVAPAFDAAANELVLPRAVLAAPIRVPEGVFGPVVDRIAQRALAALPHSVSLASRIRALVSEEPRSFSFGVGDVARRLGMSGRTLQRRLKGEGTSWAAIVDNLRRERARELELDRVSDKEITFVLGFSDASALARARARWRR